MNRRTILFASLMTALLLVAGVASAKVKQIAATKIDNLAGALTVQAGMSYTVTGAEAATAQAGEPTHTCRGGGSLPSVWFKYKADRDITVSFDTAGTNIPYGSPVEAHYEDTVMSVYALTAGSPDKAKFNKLAPVVCNDQAFEWMDYSHTRVEVEAGRWYYIQVSPFLFTTMPAGSTIRLNVDVDNLVTNGGFEGGSTGWKLQGKGKSDDSIACSGDDCEVVIQQSALGASKLTQSVNSFKGIKAPKGSFFYVSANVSTIGGLPDATMTLKIVYKDGTSTTASDQVSWIGTGSGMLVAVVQTAKPVAKVVVQFVVRDNLSVSTVVIDDVRLKISPKGMPPREAPAGVLPAPAAPR